MTNNDTAMNDTATDEIQIDLVKLLKQLWRRALIIVLAALVFAAGAFVFAGREKKQETEEQLEEIEYTARALMYVKPVILSDSEDNGTPRTTINADDMSAARSKVATYTVILRSRGVLEEVIEEQALDYTYEELYSMVSAASVSGTEFFEIAVTGKDAEETARIANALADILPARIAQVVQGDDVSVVDYAGTPSLPPEEEEQMQEEQQQGIKARLKPAILGAFVGGVLAAAVIVCVYLFSGKIHDEDYLAQAYPDVPLLTVVPDQRRGGKERADYYGGRASAPVAPAAVKKTDKRPRPAPNQAPARPARPAQPEAGRKKAPRPPQRPADGERAPRPQQRPGDGQKGPRPARNGEPVKKPRPAETPAPAENEPAPQAPETEQKGEE